LTSLEYLRVWRELLGLSFRRLPGLTTIALATMGVNVIVPAAIALALERVVDASTSHDVTAAVIGALGAGLAYCLTLLLGNLIIRLRGLLIERVGLTDVESGIIASIYGIEGIGHLERTDYLDRVTVLRNSAWGLMDSLWAMLQSVFGFGQIALTLTLLGSVSPWLLFLLPFAAVPLWFEQRGRLGVARAETDSAEEFRLQRHLFSMATSASAGKEVRVSDTAQELVARQAAAWDAAIQVRLRALVVAALLRACGWAIFAAGFASGMVLVAWQAAHGHDSVGAVVLTIMVANSLRSAVSITVSRSTVAAGYRRLLDPFLWLRAYAAHEHALAAGVPGGRLSAPACLRTGIVLSDVSYTYPGTTRAAVSRVSATLPAGAVVAVVGEYGSGKTTLINLLCKFYRPSEGTITVDGTDLALLDTASWRSVISTAFQDFGRYRATLRETLQLGGLDGADGQVLPGDDAVLAAVRAADATDLLAQLPNGLDSELGVEFGGVELSEGQWQKTALARACMRSSPVLMLLDEPTASLDAPSEHAIFQHHMSRARAIGQAAGAVTVIVSHRFSTVAGADLILVMDSGRLAEVGSHSELVAASGRYAELYGIQAAAYTTPAVKNS
jgi:ABC-type multidrug transport system fused ATPase/permease subunit